MKEILWIVTWTVLQFVSKPCQHKYTEEQYGITPNYTYADLCGYWETTKHEKIFTSSTTAMDFIEGMESYSQIVNPALIMRVQRNGNSPEDTESR